MTPDYNRENERIIRQEIVPGVNEMNKKILKDIYETLYESVGIVRLISKFVLIIVGKFSSRVREKIGEGIHIKAGPELERTGRTRVQIADSDSIPFVKINFEIHNDNHSPLRIDALNINLSLSRRNSVFRSFYWDRNTFSTPPKNIQLSTINGKSSEFVRVEFIFPYYLYFPEEDMNVYADGHMKFYTDVGTIEREFESKFFLKRDLLWNNTTAQDDLVRRFSPLEPACEKERESE